ncbi:MAG: hypothetical protein NNA31_09625 [Nitrospira sp.]|nr:hypothetical protein [Nitrospira sp.]
MSDEVTCPSCNAEGTKRLSDVIRQEAIEGVRGGMAEQYNPPRQPWGYVQGFLLAIPINVGIILGFGTPGGSENEKAMLDLITTIGFLGVWIGYGTWRNKSYKKKLEEWKNIVAAKLHCLKCGHVFEG